MNPLAYLQFFVPKRHALLHKLYRRLYRLNAWSIQKSQEIRDYPINMNGTRMCVYLFFGAGPVIVFLFALLTLLIP